MKGQPTGLAQRFDHEVSRGAVVISALVLFELRYGIPKSTKRGSNEARPATFLQSPVLVLSFDPEDAEEAGDIRAALERAGTPIGR